MTLPRARQIMFFGAFTVMQRTPTAKHYGVAYALALLLGGGQWLLSPFGWLAIPRGIRFFPIGLLYVAGVFYDSQPFFVMRFSGVLYIAYALLGYIGWRKKSWILFWVFAGVLLLNAYGCQRYMAYEIKTWSP